MGPRAGCYQPRAASFPVVPLARTLPAQDRDRASDGAIRESFQRCLLDLRPLLAQFVGGLLRERRAADQGRDQEPTLRWRWAFKLRGDASAPSTQSPGPGDDWIGGRGAHHGSIGDARGRTGADCNPQRQAPRAPGALRQAPRVRAVGRRPQRRERGGDHRNREDVREGSARPRTTGLPFEGRARLGRGGRFHRTGCKPRQLRLGVQPRRVRHVRSPVSARQHDEGQHHDRRPPSRLPAHALVRYRTSSRAPRATGAKRCQSSWC